MPAGAMQSINKQRLQRQQQQQQQRQQQSEGSRCISLLSRLMTGYPQKMQKLVTVHDPRLPANSSSHSYAKVQTGAAAAAAAGAGVLSQLPISGDAVEAEASNV
ncbi:hypothetical protein AWZ03_004687 [Drosophila navojoa]|uniref:Uncharacterized protein n=1 Tax=Drosophila navojoa TaxID=7232 RepID=A0A484BJF3_DRONA|nr:hypothetical protein AWZ03_004687 [Drosophila navojoa]